MDNFTPLTPREKKKKKANKFLIIGNLVLVTVIALAGILYYNSTLQTTQQKASVEAPADCAATGNCVWDHGCTWDECTEWEGGRKGGTCKGWGTKRYKSCKGGGGGEGGGQSCPPGQWLGNPVDTGQCHQSMGFDFYSQKGACCSEKCKKPKNPENDEECTCNGWIKIQLICIGPEATATPAPTATPTPTPTPPTATNTPTPTPTTTGTPTPTPTSTGTPTPTPTGTIVPSNTPTVTPTGTPGPSPTPIPVLCGTKSCDNATNPCRANYNCIQAHDGSNYCSSPDFVEACKANPTYDNCCTAPGAPTATPTEIILAKVSASPTVVVNLLKTGVVKSFMYFVPAAIMLIGLIL